MVGQEAFNILKEQFPDLLKEFLEERRRRRSAIRERQQGAPEVPKIITAPTYQTNNSDLPRQYSANNTTIGDHITGVDGWDEDDVTSCATDTETDDLTIQDLQDLLSAHADSNDRHAHIQVRNVEAKQSNANAAQMYTIVDGGTDTHVLGEGFDFFKYTEGRLANLVGFDAGLRRNHRRIGSAAAVFLDVDSNPLLGIFHEAVHNPGQGTSLLCPYQSREHGLIIDDTAKVHRRADNQWGTQRICDPDTGSILPLTVRGCLLMTPHRLPTKEDYESLPRVVFSSPSV